MLAEINEKYLPDFDAMNTLAGIIAQYKLDADRNKLELECYIASCIQSAYLEKENWVNGKPPTQTYIDNVVRIVGNNKEDQDKIKLLTEQYRVAQRMAEESSSLLETMRNKVATFQTVSSNKRSGLM